MNILEKAIFRKNERIEEFKKEYNDENPLLKDTFDYSQDQDGNSFSMKKKKKRNIFK